MKNSTSTSPTSSSSSQVLGLGYFDAIARRLASVLKNRVLVNVTHLPMSCVWLTSNTFVLNGHVDLFPDLNYTASEGAVAPDIQDFASVLSSFLDHLNVKDTLFAVGMKNMHVAAVNLNTAKRWSNSL